MLCGTWCSYNKNAQEIIVTAKWKSNNYMHMWSPSKRPLACVVSAMILSNGKIIAEDTPSNLVKNINAKNAYFGDNFKFN